MSCFLVTVALSIAFPATNTFQNSVEDSAPTLVEVDDNISGPIKGDFEGPVKKLTVLLMIKQISDGIHDLFAKRTEFESIERELLKNETKVDYIFPDEAVIIEGIGKVISKFLNNSQQAVQRIHKAAEEGIENHTWADHSIQTDQDMSYLDGSELPIRRGDLNLTLKYRKAFGIECNTTYSTISVAIDVYKYASDVLNFAKATRALDDIFRKNLEETRYIGWQYFGSKYGAMRTYPGLYEKLPIDPRYRPWYVDGSTYPRHLLLMVDTSGSMYGFPMKLARIVAEKLIHTLSEHDLVNIILYNSSHVTGPSSCFDGLVRATPEIKQQFIQLVKDAEVFGPDKVEETLRWSIQFLKNNTNKADNCHSSLVVLTDSSRKINKDLFDELDPDHTINILTFSFFNTLKRYDDFESISCGSKGLFEVIRNIGDYQKAVLQFTEFYQKNRLYGIEERVKPMWSNVYYDQAGLGYVITTTLPVTAIQTFVDNKHSTNLTRFARSFVGVVGVDVFIKQLNRLVLDFFANGDYVIITNNFGNVILHPNSHQRKVKTDNSYSPEITQLLDDVEHSQNHSTVEELSRNMIDRKQGKLTTNSLFYLQNMPKGEETVLKTTYFYGPIPDTPFAFAIASRHKLGYPDMNTPKIRDIFDNSENLDTLKTFIIGLHDNGFLKLKSRYNCSIVEFSQTKYYGKSEVDREANLFCDFEKADVCEPNYCVKRHFQNMMYDLWKIYIPIVNQGRSCRDDEGLVNSCFVITGSGIYVSSTKGWLTNGNIESGQETLELKTKNQEFKSAILVTRPIQVRGHKGLYVNITKSVSTTSQASEVFLATVGMEVNLEVLKSIISKSVEGIGHLLDIMVVDENMLIISGFKSDGGATDGKSLKIFYPKIANKLVMENIFFEFKYHECDHECKVEIPKKDSCIGENNYWCNTAPKSKMKLCCQEFATYSRKRYTLHVPTAITVLSNQTFSANCTCDVHNASSCPQCSFETCSAKYAVADIPNTNILAIIRLTPECTQKPEEHKEEPDIIYSHGICDREVDYYSPSKKCFSVETPSETPAECLQRARTRHSNAERSDIVTLRDWTGLLLFSAWFSYFSELWW